MKKVLLIAISVFIVGVSKAQNALSDLGCGTLTIEEERAKIAAFLEHGSRMKSSTSGDTIPLSIHIVGTNSGGGYYSLDNLFKVICNLNQHFAPVGFYFYIKGQVNYINNTTFYEHNYWTGYQMMNQNNVSNTINVYFVADPSGACGYYAYGPDAVAIKNSCGGVNSTTLTHELGHFFGLPHTFSGWENGTPGNPELVTRGLGANCGFAGDGFCDTDADYISNRWNCPYTGVMFDANGDRYHPDSSLYMSYSTDACMSRFSNLQMGSMQYNYDLRFDLHQSHPTWTALSEPKIILPGNLVYLNDKKIRWNKIDEAEYYHVRVTFDPPGIPKQELFTTDTVIELDFTLSELPNYLISVTPISGMNTCRQKTGTLGFRYSNTLGVAHTTNTGTGLFLSSNPVDQHLKVQVQLTAHESGMLDLINMAGQLVYSVTVRQGGLSEVLIPVSEFASGVYMVRLHTNSAVQTARLVVRH